MSRIIGVQRRMMELGRIRLGDKAASGAPRKLTKFRLTSASRALLEAAGEIYGGTVTEWTGAPDEGYHELYTETDTLQIVLPPVFDSAGEPSLPYSQAYELWSGGGCQRRCDGQTETLTGKPCICGPMRGEKDHCKITTRLNVMLPELPGLGVWRLESHGWNAASILPGTLDLLLLAASEQQFIPAVLRLEARTSKQGGTTRKFVVPVIDLPTVRLAEIAGAAGLPGINPPTPPPERPLLPVGPDPTPDTFDNQDPEFGAAPPLPNAGGEPIPDDPAVASGTDSASTVALFPPVDSSEPASPPATSFATTGQKDKLNVLIGQLRDGKRMTTALIYKRVRPATLPTEPEALAALRWRDLRETLTKAEAHDLIEWLRRYELHLAAEKAAAS